MKLIDPLGNPIQCLKECKDCGRQITEDEVGAHIRILGLVINQICKECVDKNYTVMTPEELQTRKDNLAKIGISSDPRDLKCEPSRIIIP